MGSGVKQQGKQVVAALMAFLGERRRLEGDVCGKDLQRALWTDPPKVRIMPGIPRKLDYQGRMKYKKDCGEVFPQIMIGTGNNFSIFYKLSLICNLNNFDRIFIKWVS